MQTITYHISGLICGGCVARAKQVLLPLADYVEITLTPPQAVLTNPNASLEAMNQALQAAGNYVLSTQSSTVLGKLKSLLR